MFFKKNMIFWHFFQRQVTLKVTRGQTDIYSRPQRPAGQLRIWSSFHFCKNLGILMVDSNSHKSSPKICQKVQIPLLEPFLFGKGRASLVRKGSLRSPFLSQKEKVFIRGATILALQNLFFLGKGKTSEARPLISVQ